MNYYRDTWAMIDSYKQLFPEMEKDIMVCRPRQASKRTFLSNMLIKIIENDSSEITRDWSEDIRNGIPSIFRYLDVLTEVNTQVLKKGQRKGLSVQRGLRNSPGSRIQARNSGVSALSPAGYPQRHGAEQKAYLDA